MRSQILIPVILLLSLTLTLISCKTTTSKIFSIASLDTTIETRKILISDLAKNYKLYHGQYIETTGRFYRAFEEFAIYTDKNIFTREADGFWLGTNQKLNIDNASFEKMDGKRVTIKGKIDTIHKGHLNSYLARIDRIYFGQQ